MNRRDVEGETAKAASRAEACDVRSQPKKSRPWVIGPLGERLTLDKLPRPGFRHWLPIRKAEVVAAVSGGLITLEEAIRRYNLTIEEYAAWERAVDRFGVQGLRATRIARYREIHMREQKF